MSCCIQNDNPPSFSQYAQSLLCPGNRFRDGIVFTTDAECLVQIDANCSRFELSHTTSSILVLRVVGSVGIDSSSYSESPLIWVVETSSSIAPVSVEKLWYNPRSMSCFCPECN